MDPIPMRLCENPKEFKTAGDFCWDLRGGKRTLVIAIPINASGRWESMRWSIDYKNLSGASWEWDGNETSPTLHPSIHAVGIFHGWVQEGILKTDSFS